LDAMGAVGADENSGKNYCWRASGDGGRAIRGIDRPEHGQRFLRRRRRRDGGQETRGEGHSRQLLMEFGGQPARNRGPADENEHGSMAQWRWAITERVTGATTDSEHSPSLSRRNRRYLPAAHARIDFPHCLAQITGPLPLPITGVNY
jgi:hypothetical protein